jgi:hypothetical protein
LKVHYRVTLFLKYVSLLLSSHLLYFPLPSSRFFRWSSFQVLIPECPAHFNIDRSYGVRFRYSPLFSQDEVRF